MANLDQNPIWSNTSSKSDNVMGPSYSYADNVQGPSDMGVSSNGIIFTNW
jgi:hypothetical protein